MKVNIYEPISMKGMGQTILAQLPPPFSAGSVHLLNIDPFEFYDKHRDQVDALALLEKIPKGQSETNLALVEEDLFIQILTFVFGLSELNGKRSVLSAARLTTPRQLTVEAVHELGHSLGLKHCPVGDCPMHRTLWPEQVDLKNIDYCPSCFESASDLINS